MRPLNVCVYSLCQWPLLLLLLLLLLLSLLLQEATRTTHCVLLADDLYSLDCQGIKDTFAIITNSHLISEGVCGHEAGVFHTVLLSVPGVFGLPEFEANVPSKFPLRPNVLPWQNVCLLSVAHSV